MTNKVYEKTKKYIKENTKTFITIIIIILLFTIKLPYNISAPGGAIDTTEKLKITSDFKMEGSLNMAYVTELEGTIPLLAYSLINPNWDIEKKQEKINSNETIQDETFRNKMLLEEANDLAQLVAYDNSNIPYEITNNKIYVTYIDTLAKTNLKIGDQIIKVDNIKITNKEELYTIIKNKKPKEKIKFTVKRNKKETNCWAKLINIKGETKIGLIITETIDIKSNYNINIKFKSTESGSSGGLMMTLAIYSYLNEIDLTKGKKIIGTGTIDKEGNVGQISGIKYKLIGAVKQNADIFIVPSGENYKEALKIKKQKNYNIKIIPVKTFKQALEKLNKL